MSPSWSFKDEAAALAELSSPRAALAVLVVLVVTAAVLALLGSIERVGRRVAVGSARRFTQLLDLSRLAAVVTATYLVLRQVIVAAPMIGTIVTVVTMGLVTAANLDRVRSLIVGVMPRWRQRVRLGDRIHSGDTEGVVRRFGVFGLELETMDGERVHVPNHMLASGPLVVQRARDAIQVSVTIPNVPQDERTLEQLRRAVLLSPYRVAGSPVGVTPRGKSVVLQLQAWSKEATKDASRQLERAAELAIERAAPKDEPAEGA